MLRAAAAGGRRVDDALLAEAVEMPPGELHDALHEAVDRGILVPVPGAPSAYAFRHALLQEVVLGELFAGERQRLHAAFARALTARAASGSTGGAPVPSAEELAHHWDAAGDWAHALPAVVEAGYAAEHAYAFAEALRHYERALELWDRVPDADDLVIGDRPSLLERAAEMASLTGEYGRAVELSRGAVAAAPVRDDDPRRLLFRERLRWFLWEAGDRASAEAELEEAARLAPTLPPSAARARVFDHLAGLHMYAGRYEASRLEAEAALPHARAAGARAEEAMALGILGWDVALLGDVDAGIAYLREALRIAQEVDSIEGIALGYSTLAALLELVGRPDEAIAVAREGRAAAARYGVARTYGGLLLGSEASALLALGRWDEAREAIDEGLAHDPVGRPAIALHVQAARLDTARASYADAEHHLEVARMADERLGGTDQRTAILAATAELAAWQARIAEVRAAVAEGLRSLPDVLEPAHGWLALSALRAEADAAERARARRDEAAAAEAVRAFEAIVAILDPPSGGTDRSARPAARSGAFAERFESLLLLAAAERGRLSGARDASTWVAAAMAFERRGRPYPAAYARFREAEARLSAREGRLAAAGPLRSAKVTTDRLGAAALGAEVALLARQARIDLSLGGDQAGSGGHPAPGREVGAQGGRGDGAAPRAASPLDGFGLTDREAEVLRLVAGGWTNQQIADELFIARKTASVHVSNILGKLGVDSRVEAAAMAHRLGLGADAPPPPDAIA